MSGVLRQLAVFLTVAVGVAFPQSAPKPGDSKPDYSKEAFVIEEEISKITFENDGTGTRESTSRIRIQSNAGVQRYGVLTLPYQKADQTVDVDYVRVIKPDGSVVSTPLDDIQDMPSEITRQAPFYSDSREKHIAVKGLSPGDVLEFRERWHTTSPLAPGQFWLVYNFSHDAIILREELQVSVPRARPLKWKSAGAQPVMTEDGERRIFTWASAQLERKSADDEKKDQEEKLYQMGRGKLPPPDIQISTFQSWEEVGNWYNGLQRDRVKPTPEIRAKAAKLTKNAADDNARLHSIYNYVGTQFHYIGVAFGIGRYQPHSAAEVLDNQYGDCKDKHTLLASLLDAAGIKAYPALISALRELDPDVPSPAQFDHVISAVPQGNNLLWLDTTQEVAPFGYLLSVLRDKQALVIPADKPPLLVTTPLDSPGHPSEHFVINAKLSDNGTLEGKIERETSGADTEVLMRMAFRGTPSPQWQELVQRVSYASGFAGDVSGVTASPPEKTQEPFHLSYTYTRKDFPDWSNRRIACAVPPFALPAFDPKPSHPIWLGSPQELHYESHVELPKGYSPELPANADLKEDFGEYHSAYSAKDGVLSVDRRVAVKLREVPLSEYETYKKFAKTVADDYERYVALSSASSTPGQRLQNAIANLPGSDSAEAMSDYSDAMTELQKGNVTGAIDSLNEALVKDPKYARASLFLAQVYANTGRKDKALETLEKAYHADPHQSVIYQALVGGLTAEKRYERAASVLQEVIKDEPSNVDALSALGSALVNLKRYGEAASALESAVKVAPERPGLHFQLGTAYMGMDEGDKAAEAYKREIALDSSPLMLNNIAYTMADANKNLPPSLEYAQKAVKAEEDASAKVTLSGLKLADLGHTSSLAVYWDTLGWVYFRTGNLDQAEKYINASYTLSPVDVVGDHLAQIRKQPGRSAPLGSSDANLMRTVKLNRLVPGTASAEFFVLLSQNPGTSQAKVEDVKFISGSDELKSADQALRSAKLKVLFPDDGPTRLVRRGILGCYAYTGCSFVMFLPGDVHSVD